MPPCVAICVKMAAANRNQPSVINNTYSKGDKLVQPNFQFEKRQRELAKKKKKEEKKQRKLEGENQPSEENPVPPSGEEKAV